MSIGNTVLLHHVYRWYDTLNGWLCQKVHTLSCPVYGKANPFVSSYMPLGLGLTVRKVRIRPESGGWQSAVHLRVDCQAVILVVANRGIRAL
jgi:hypothetical protein